MKRQAIEGTEVTAAANEPAVADATSFEPLSYACCVAHENRSMWLAPYLFRALSQHRKVQLQRAASRLIPVIFLFLASLFMSRLTIILCRYLRFSRVVTMPFERTRSSGARVTVSRFSVASGSAVRRFALLDRSISRIKMHR